MPMRNMIAIFLAIGLSLMCYTKAGHNRYGADISQAMDLIAFNYLEDVDYRGLYEDAMRGMTTGLDPYSSYISPADFVRFQEDIDQEFGGIGILVEFNRESNRLVVMSPMFDTPASRAGVRAGDTIIAIDGRDTSAVSFREAVDLIRGKPGSIVKLTILHAGEQTPIEVEIPRAIIPIESVLGDQRRPDGGWDFHLRDNPRITYVRLINFGENTVRELSQLLQTTKPQALILDLRDNAGGLLDAAVGTCDAFLREGTIVTIRGRDGEVQRKFEADGGALLDEHVPMAVLVNHFSASASEIVAACLQDHQRAKIIGQRTWGKGTVQQVIRIEGGRAALKLTTASYWRPNNHNIHRLSDATDEDEWGVRPDPDFAVELTDEQANEVRQHRRRLDGSTTSNGEHPTTPDDKPSPDEADKPDAKAADPDTDGAQTEERQNDDATDSLGDPQLRRAVEYLQQRLEPAPGPAPNSAPSSS